MNREQIIKTTLLVLCIFVSVFLISISGKLFEKVNADEILVIQDPIDGDLHFYTQAGIYFQKLGKVTKYQKSFQYWFSNLPDQGTDEDQAIKIRFNDGGNATVSGSVRVDLPFDSEHLTVIHTRLGNQRAVTHEVVRPMMEKVVYMTGPLISSKESYSEFRPDLLRYIEDQAIHGVYRTNQKTIKATDLMTGKEKTVILVELVRGDNGVYLRQDVSPVQQYGILVHNLSLNSIDYDEGVEKQIVVQQAAVMEVQTAMAEARKAEQKAITVAKEGEAKAAEAKWQQETIKAKAVVQAQQELEVAALNRQAAEQKKQEQILLGQGESTRKQLVMSADGALTQKLEAWVKVNEMYAAAIAKYSGAWVPSVIMGQNKSDGNGAEQLINLLTAKTAKDLSLTLSIPDKQK